MLKWVRLMNTVYSIIGSPLAVIAALVGLGLAFRTLRVLLKVAWWFGGFFLSLALILGVLQLIYASKPYPQLADMQWGISFSPGAAADLGQDWQATYAAILNELHPAVIRLPAYWNSIEATQGEYNFDELDWLSDQAAASNTPVIIAIGQKAPRWPECHYPDWIDRHDSAAVAAAITPFLQTVADHYKDRPNLQAWQIENEPYLKFARFTTCPKISAQQVADEIATVRTTDPDHAIQTTDSGEAGGWLTAMRQGDSFGTTLYRVVYDENFDRLTKYPYTPEMYTMKRDLAHLLSGTLGKPAYIAELQAEPWGPKGVSAMTTEEAKTYFPLDQLQENLNYAARLRFDDPTLLWGAEWWYSMKQHGAPEYWDTIKSVMN